MSKTYCAIVALVIGATAPLSRADDGLELAKRNHCTACHRVDRKLIGPGYAQVASKYAGDQTAEARLVAKVRGGGVGVWGQIPMPSNDTASDPDIKSLVEWILHLPPPEPAADQKSPPGATASNAPGGAPQ